MVVSESAFIVVDEPDAYRTGVPFESSSHELHGFGVVSNTRVLIDELREELNAAPEVPNEAQPAGQARRLLSRTQAVYYTDDLSGPLPLGQCGVRALPYESRAAVLSEGQRAAVFGTDVDAALLEGEGGYLQADGLWWTRSGRQVFDPAQFYAPVIGRDPFGNEASVVYDDHHLFVAQVTDALDNVVSFEHDYRVLAPDHSTDPNGNRTRVGFDTFGRVVWMAVMGKDGEGEGDTPEDPTATFSYDVFAWHDRGEPLSAYGRAREVHGDPSTRWQEIWSYFDGSGATLLAKANAEPGDAPVRDANGLLVLDGEGNPVLAPTDTRFVGSGRTVFDNKGNPIKQYEPYFSSTSGYEDEEELREQGVTPVLHYDPLGRVVRTDFPDGTHARVEFGPWTQVSYDRGDNAVGSPWEAERLALASGDPDRRAATLSAASDSTPTVTRTDALGRAVRVVTENVGDEFAEARMVLDIVGNTLEVIDARGNTAQQNVVGMAGQVLQETSVDAGWRRVITDVVGNPLRGFNERGFTSRLRYDAGLRPTHQFVASAGSEVLTTRTVYGESLDSPEVLNLRGRVYRVYDGAGVQTVEFDFKGGLVAAERRLALDVTQTLDWSALADLVEVSDIETAAAPMLESETFRMESTFDALGRPTTQTTPEGTVVHLAYNEAALLDAVSANVRGAANETSFVSNIDYDAKGRRMLIAYGNGTQTTYAYDDVTQRLTRLQTQRQTTGATRTFQDLAYTYDVVGNIVQITDTAQQDIYHNGQVTSGTQRYEYDALYRLIHAEGREHIGQNAAQPTAHDLPPVAHPQDGTAMRNYAEQYVYDLVGNILSMQHTAASGSWTRRYKYAANGNRLLANSAPGDAADVYSQAYSYDAHGNMTSMPHLSAASLNHADQMRSADLGGGGTVYFVYDAAGQRIRKVRVNQNGTQTFERIYLGAYELYRERTNGNLQLERETLHIADDAGRMCDLETRTVESGTAVATPTTHHRYQYSNHLGSASLELTGSAEVISYQEYHPYGTSAYWAVNSSIDVSAQRYRYTGKERDEETGLSYHGARYYACWLGRWTASDPIGLGDGVNRYAYVAGRPISLTDPGGTKGKRRAGVDARLAGINARLEELEDEERQRLQDLRDERDMIAREMEDTSKEVERLRARMTEVSGSMSVEIAKQGETTSGTREQRGVSEKVLDFADRIDVALQYQDDISVSLFKVIKTIRSIKNVMDTISDVRGGVKLTTKSDKLKATAGGLRLGKNSIALTYSLTVWAAKSLAKTVYATQAVAGQITKEQYERAVDNLEDSVPDSLLGLLLMPSETYRSLRKIKRLASGIKQQFSDLRALLQSANSQDVSLLDLYKTVSGLRDSLSDFVELSTEIESLLNEFGYDVNLDVYEKVIDELNKSLQSMESIGVEQIKDANSDGSGFSGLKKSLEPAYKPLIHG